MKKTRVSSSSKKSNQEQYLYLTTRGRRSSMPREIEIWFTERVGRFYLIAEYPNSHWVRNICAHPRVEVKLADNRFQAQARLLSPETESELCHEIQELSRKKYGWGEGVIVEITPFDSCESER